MHTDTHEPPDTHTDTQFHRLSLPFKRGSSLCLLAWNHFVRLSASPENRPSLSQATEWTRGKAVREQDGMKGGNNERHFFAISFCTVHKDYVLYYVFLTSLTEIHWVQQVK